MTTTSLHSHNATISSSSNVWQEILSLDAKFNLYRINSNSQLRTQYMRRRTQLMRDNSVKNGNKPDVVAQRRDYLQLRSQILERKYGQLDRSSLSGQSIKTNANNNNNSYSYYKSYNSHGNIRNSADSVSLNSDSLYGNRMLRYNLSSNMATALNPQHKSSFMYSSKESLGLAPRSNNNSSKQLLQTVPNSDDSSYSLASVYHEFETHRASVTRLRFANNDKSLLASSSIDGSLCIYQVIPSPATIIYKLEGHQAGILDFQWSTTNDMIVTASLDGTSRVWQVAKGKCMRILKDATGSQVLCCCFQPLNENMIFTGNSKGFIQVYNLSTGILANKNCLQKINARVQSMCFDSSGFNLWIGDDKGGISTYGFDVFTLKLSKTRKMVNNPGYSITSLAFKNLNMKESCLLVNAMPNYLLLYKIVNSTSNESSNIVLHKRVAIKQAERALRSIFCPKVASRMPNGSLLVCSGSEDCFLYIYDMNNQESPVVTRLQGHNSPVMDVSINYDQSLMASGDHQGAVIVWRTNNQL